jgi:hypothetical protein
MGYEATIFTDDAVKLGDELGTEVTKTAALEINRFVSIGGGPESADLVAVDFADIICKIYGWKILQTMSGEFLSTLSKES